LKTLASDILGTDASPVKVLLVDDVNPVFSAPPAWRVRDALMKVPFIASFGSFVDDTSTLADLILPDHSFLESWIARTPESGASMAVVSVAGPALRPLHNTRAMPDVLLQVGSGLARPLDLPWKTFDEMLMEAFSKLPAPSADTDAWTAAQKQGGWWGEPLDSAQGRAARARGTDAAERRQPAGGGAQAGAPRVVDPQFDGDANTYPFHFLPYASQAFLDGSLAHLPWLQELPDAISTAMWSSWIEINPQTAAKNGIAEGDVVEVTSTQGTLRVPALLSPGIAPDVVAMPVGQGHESFTRYASGRGANPVRLVAAVTEPETGSLAWAATRVRLSRVGGPDGGLILFAGEKTENPLGGLR
jgi:anaerobic selenocysteine-containing dehydrogenase